jgi:hypothetical protein
MKKLFSFPRFEITFAANVAEHDKALFFDRYRRIMTKILVGPKKVETEIFILPYPFRGVTGMMEALYELDN